MSAIAAAEPAIRAGIFLGVLALMALWEALAPRRRQTVPRRLRWPGNLGIVVVDTIVLRLLFPIGAVGIAVAAEQQGWGLLNMAGGKALPAWATVPATVLLLDLLVYGQHVLFHAVSVLWRVHRMHHADLEYDTTTALRFHPVEIVLSLLIKGAAVVAVGAPPAGVLAFEVLLNASALFNHGNVRLPAGLDRALRLVAVTPDMHRVHHSAVRRETDSNFGFALACWDRLFGTYRAQPAAGHEGMTIGLASFRDPAELRLDRMLLQPFRPVDAAAVAADQEPGGRAPATSGTKVTGPRSSSS
ncbi:MAG TPA: sterol desaturase family protein [Stellaceae bacterium]|jgi:sterol desaturase/sphingolipid hydroxylase (fatty acid hydroxylase superfamily)